MENDQQNLIGSRLASVDALRGFDMLWIIGGGAIFANISEVYSHPVTDALKQQFSHVEWEGFHFEDLIFPLFLFIVGVVLPFSITRRLERGHNRAGLYLHIFKRSAIIILLGLIYNGLLRFDWAQMRWPGVLQRIGICYFFAALIIVNTKWRTQAIIIVTVLILYWIVTMFVPVPNYGAGDLSMEGCLSSYIDQKLIPGQLYYGHGDNEGIISTFPAICTVLLGALAGHWLRSGQLGDRKAAGLTIAGIASLLIGCLWAQVFPVIKILWTSSYVLIAGDMSLLLLSLFYWIIDVKGYRKWAYFFIIIGMNPITIYFTQRFVDFDRIARFFLIGIIEHINFLEPVIMPLGVVLAKWLFLWFLYRHRIFFKA